VIKVVALASANRITLASNMPGETIIGLLDFVVGKLDACTGAVSLDSLGRVVHFIIWTPSVCDLVLPLSLIIVRGPLCADCDSSASGCEGPVRRSHPRDYRLIRA